eukprot:Rhum_TRINITY_DN2131_c0_g1::Rhum_TRINITY_DN2131_c0_g1_i1::g.6095::m.6095/K00905/BCKDK; [3-methyl-2-oxobutanoate dehydrogenase (acetyl-transferring)] kinase
MLRRSLPRFIASAFDFDFYDPRIANYAARRAEPLPLATFKEWYDTGRLTEENVVNSARYLHKELPLRIAKTLVSFERLPLLVLKQHGMLKAFRSYFAAFEAMLEVQGPQDLASAEEYDRLVDRLVKDTADLLTALSEGLQQTRGKLSSHEVVRLDEFTHLFIGHRLARRMLAANHAALLDHYRQQQSGGRLSTSEVGIFHRTAPVRAIVEASAEEAQGLCMLEYGQFPEFEVTDLSKATLFCVPANLQAILMEVLKNSMKATVERHDTAVSLPQVRARIRAAYDGTVSIELEDQGGGMSKDSEASLWRYGVSGTTLLDKLGRLKQGAEPTFEAGIFGVRDVHTKRLSGYGFGLPLSKARANYFGGELWIHNMEGYGIDTYIRMPPATSRWGGR